ncbi:MAG TPA: PepSY domain-containing protein [Robiginitalea sp.]|nr:PepSY domain-containing protein [Robiginitalea sp.]
MVKRKTAIAIRKTHRYLGLFLGIQFIFWTVSGLYFSWTDIDAIHGDHFRQLPPKRPTYSGLLPPVFPEGLGVYSLELRSVAGKPHYWVNDSLLIDAATGERRSGITAAEARAVAADHMREDLQVISVEQITEFGPHHEYRGRPLPAYVFTYDHPEAIKAYVSIADGRFQTVRYRSWRWFDFLWMTHTMDYQGRDNFNTTLLRAFSLLGLITVISGFVLWGVSSPRLRKAAQLQASNTSES